MRILKEMTGLKIIVYSAYQYLACGISNLNSFNSNVYSYCLVVIYCENLKVKLIFVKLFCLLIFEQTYCTTVFHGQ